MPRVIHGDDANKPNQQAGGAKAMLSAALGSVIPTTLFFLLVLGSVDYELNILVENEPRKRE